MKLAERLAGMSPADSDIYLSNVWKRFSNSEEFEALMWALNEIAEQANGLLLGPTTEDRARAHAAGQVAAVRRLLVTISQNVNFDPTKAQYAPPPGTVIQGGPDESDDTTPAPNADYGITPYSE